MGELNQEHQRTIQVEWLENARLKLNYEIDDNIYWAAFHVSHVWWITAHSWQFCVQRTAYRDDSTEVLGWLVTRKWMGLSTGSSWDHNSGYCWFFLASITCDTYKMCTPGDSRCLVYFATVCLWELLCHIHRSTSSSSLSRMVYGKETNLSTV